MGQLERMCSILTIVPGDPELDGMLYPAVRRLLRFSVAPNASIQCAVVAPYAFSAARPGSTLVSRKLYGRACVIAPHRLNR